MLDTNLKTQLQAYLARMKQPITIVATLDASLGGVGGCPFAPGATGNIPTEDLLYLLERSGYETGISLEAAIETGRWLQEQLGRPVPGMLVKAGRFPRSAA